MNVRRDQGD
jgi:hypothetical protein